MDQLMFGMLKALGWMVLVALALHVLFYLFTGGSPISGAVRMFLG